MNIDEMPEGREMDALVAEKVIGFVHKKSHGLDFFLPPNEIPPEDSRLFLWPSRPVPHYSTDISDAWRVVEKMAERDDDDFYNELDCVTPLIALNSMVASKFICRAALKVVMSD